MLGNPLAQLKDQLSTLFHTLSQKQIHKKPPPHVSKRGYVISCDTMQAQYRTLELASKNKDHVRLLSSWFLSSMPYTDHVRLVFYGFSLAYPVKSLLDLFFMVLV